MLDPIVRTIEVPCSQADAFSIFVNDMPTWWPLGRFSMSAKAKTVARSLRVEPKSGGMIVEVGQDGAEYLWGTIRTYQPNDYLSMDFHMGTPPDAATLVEIRFTALEPERTRVQLTQSNWEAAGDMADMLRGGYGVGWTVIFEQGYAEACRRLRV
jgi:uncharacterized protein YndB with AHSA1/START domain